MRPANNHPKIMSLLLLLIMFASLAGCSGLAPTAAPTKAAELKDTFVIARIDPPYNFDPGYIAENIDIWNIPNICEPLVRVSSDGKSLEPALATTWEISQDGKDYTFHLRPGVVFFDGTPLKASDVKWSLDRARGSDTPWGYIFSDIDSIEVKDDSTVVVHIKGLNSAFLSVMAMFNAEVVSQAYGVKVGKDGLAKSPMCTGPYMLKDYQSGQYALMEANPKYWGPAPKTKYIKWISVPDDNTRILQVQSGQVDAAEYIPLNRVDELKADPKINMVLFPSTFVYYLVPNYNLDLFKDKNVRLALYYATDRAALVKTVLFNHGQVANSFMSPVTPMYAADVKTADFDLAKAKDALSKTKYPNGFKMRLLIVAGDQTDQMLATALKEMWSKIGVDTTIQALEYGARQDLLTKRDYDTHLTFWTDDVLDPDEITTYECDFPVAGSMNSDYNNPDMIKLVEQARKEPDPAKRAQLYHQIQQLFNDDAAMLPLYYKPFSVALSAKVHGFQQLPLGTYYYRDITVDK